MALFLFLKMFFANHSLNAMPKPNALFFNMLKNS